MNIFRTPNILEQLSDVFMAVSVTANCLMHGTELPAHLPTLRDRLVYHAHKVRPSGAKSSNRVNTSVEDGDMFQPEDIHDSSVGIEADELTLDVLLVKLLFLACMFLYFLTSSSTGRTFTRTCHRDNSAL